MGMVGSGSLIPLSTAVINKKEFFAIPDLRDEKTKRVYLRRNPMAKKSDEAFEAVADEAAVEAAATPSDKDDKAVRLLKVLHERVKLLEDAKGWHDAELGKLFN